MPKIQWLDDVEPHDYDAALAYLTVLLDEGRAQAAIQALRKAPITTRRVNDILRGCHREPLPHTDPGVQRTIRKIRHGKALSPILVVSLHYGGDIADGYHRLSSTYLTDPFADVPCKLAHLPELQRTAGKANL